MPLNIVLDNFEGPFDLLLHLIKKNQMDIYNIKIHDITSQYLENINAMKELDLEVASEFIVMAAMLLEIKSKMLLPKEKKKEEEGEEDPRLELVSKLLEYKKYKFIASKLSKRENEIGIVFTKKPEIIDDLKEENKDVNSLLKGITMLELFNLYDKLISVYNSKMNNSNVMQKEIPIDKYKIEDKMVQILEDFKYRDRLYFSKITKKCKSKMEIVVSFLALLELTKLKEVKVLQQSNFREIFIERILENSGES
ncbi:MAG: segregation/condensation protein A [Clostridium sp.]|nr:segregation/condensation protein A [Clostridium sp.]